MEQQPEAQQKIFDLLLDKDDITWQSIIYELIRTEQMNPWDIDISLLTNRYINIIKQLKKMDFRISGKIILAAAILLKIKSNRLVDEDILNLDRMFDMQNGEIQDGLLNEIIDEFKGERELLKNVELIPRTPQPRKRKVSIYDLVEALQKAIEVKKRRVMKDLPPLEIKVPDKKMDISKIIFNVYGRIKGFFLNNSNDKLTFTKLIPSESKEDKVYTFIPLLHLANERKIDIFQKENFGEIEIQLLKKMVEEQKKGESVVQT